MEKHMARFLVANVPSAGINEDGTGLLVPVRDADGNEIDLVAEWATFEEIVNAFNEAAAKAHVRRRERGLIDSSTKRGDTVLQNCLGFRYAVADDRSHMVLQLQLPTGRVDISLPADMAPSFRDATARNAELLAAPQRKRGH
jgi:hypothetical protein